MDANAGLREISHRIGLDRIRAKEAWDIWDWIAENAETINQSDFGLALGAYQQLALNETIMAISRMYDSYDKEAVASMTSAVKALPSSRLASREPLIKYLVAEGASKDLTALSDEDLLLEAERFLLMRRPTKNSEEQLRRILEIRHKQIAHLALPKSALSFYESDVAFCFAWVDDFQQMLCQAFGICRVVSDTNRIGWEVSEDKSARESLVGLCKAAGIIEGRLMTNV